jgi:protease-4
MSWGKFDRVKDAIAGLSRFHTHILIVFALIFGYFLASVVVEQPKVGVIEIRTSIMGKGVADDIVEMLRYAKDTKEIKAVVLEINSPGGEVTATEEIYMNILELRKEKPVVASINQLGASGAYYIAAASNLIYAKPTSFVGSIGVVTSLPRHEIPEEDRITTGPFKRTGSSRRDWTYKVQMAQETFLNAILLQRKDKLKISKEDLARAEIYTGIEGLELGLIDEIGSNSDAIEGAARLAGISNYGLVDINQELGIFPFEIYFTYLNESSLAPTNTVPINYYLYLELEE